MELQFKPFTFLAKIAEKYSRWFKERRFAGVLYQGTPKEKEEVKAWIMDCSQNSSKRYFFVFQKNKLLGHVGLRNINFQRKHAEMGSFFSNRQDRRGDVMEKSLKFLIEEAKKLQLQLLIADFVNESQPQIKSFRKNGFTPNPYAPHYLTLKL